MTRDDHGSRSRPARARQVRERRQGPRITKQAPRSWTNKTMHRPATKIGEIKHGKP